MEQGRWVFAISLACRSRRRIANAATGPCFIHSKISAHRAKNLRSSATLVDLLWRVALLGSPRHLPLDVALLNFVRLALVLALQIAEYGSPRERIRRDTHFR